MRMSVRRWLDRWGDWLLAAVLLALSEFDLWVKTLPGDQHVTSGRAAAAGLFVLVTLPLAWRRRYPVEVLFTVIAAAVCAAFAVRPSQGPVTSFIALIVAFYSVGANCAERRALAGGGIGLAVAAVFIITGQPGTLSPGSLGIFAVAWLIGWYLRRRRGQFSGLQDRAARAEQEREAQARAAVASERGRIARELHDIVAHSVSVMVIQAQAGQRLISDTAQARAAFRAIEGSGREALVELRRLLAILRTADDQLAVGPQPGLSSLDSLIDQVREAGLPVAVRIEGQQVPLPPGVDLSAYRIIQEALTNTIKHAGPAKAEVVLRYDTGAVELEITDTGTAAAPGSGTGHGLIGMRERITLLGGDLATGPCDGGGYQVRARLPLTAANGTRP
jgi:signal transduction histidine kinase